MDKLEEYLERARHERAMHERNGATGIVEAIDRIFPKLVENEIREAYVSFETAKLLKEKGFKEKTIPFYQKDGKFCSRIGNVCQPCDWNNEYKNKYDFYSAPTQQMAMRWLREVHKIVICAEIANENDKGNTDYSNPDRWHWFFDLTNEKGVTVGVDGDYILSEYSSYEEACENAIQYCLTYLI